MKTDSGPRIALAFSGGGVRATVFHLGVLARLAHRGLLGRVRFISSVSGGSLAAGLVMARSDYRWPTDRQYLDDVLPRCLETLTRHDLQRTYVLRSIRRPWHLLAGRASVLGEAIMRDWKIDASLADLPSSPIWFINATCYQTGKNWRFEKESMGDYQTRYVRRPQFSLATAMAASAAVPGLIGPLRIKSQQHRWSEQREGRWRTIPPRYRHLHLWDGGVYDNLGTEALFKPGEGLRHGSDFLLVSDASRPLAADTRPQRFRPGFLRASMRLVDVATDQVRCLRARMLTDHFRGQPGSGVYLRMGRRTASAYRQSSNTKTHSQTDDRFAAPTPMLSDEQVWKAARMETTLRRLSVDEFGLLLRHGYEVADVTLLKYGGRLSPRASAASSASEAVDSGDEAHLANKGFRTSVTRRAA